MEFRRKPRNFPRASRTLQDPVRQKERPYILSPQNKFLEKHLLVLR